MKHDRLNLWRLNVLKIGLMVSSIFATNALAQQDQKDTINHIVTKPPKEYTLPAPMLSKLLDDMVWVEGGSFLMGSEDPKAYKREKPAHQVTVDGFYIAKTELLQSVFKQIMGWDVSYFPCDTCPVNNISWMQIQLFIERLNQATGKKFRLPTEAEWAFAAKGGNKSKGYKFSGSDNIDDIGWYAGNAQKRLQPVATKQPNELGLYDMTGNLWEFCQDDMSKNAYTVSARVNPLVLNGSGPKQVSMKVLRSSGYEFNANESPIYRRDAATSNVKMPDIGFRLAMDK